jgi:hypothetical protein
VVNNFVMHGKDIIVKQDSYDEVESPYFINSGNLGPCIAVGVYHKAKHKGYMLHVARPSASILPDEFLNYVIKETSNSTTLEVHIYGSSIDRIDGEKGVKEAEEDRDYIVQLLKKQLRTKKIKIEWCDADSTCSLTLNPETGEFTPEFTLNDEMRDESE